MAVRRSCARAPCPRRWAGSFAGDRSAPVGDPDLRQAVGRANRGGHRGVDQPVPACFFFSAPGLWTASPPLLSLFTRYCGSSSDALTSRLAACVSLVISFSTVPSAVPPWLFHSTLSPLLSFL